MADRDVLARDRLEVHHAERLAGGRDQVAAGQAGRLASGERFHRGPHSRRQVEQREHGACGQELKESAPIGHHLLLHSKLEASVWLPAPL